MMLLLLLLITEDNKKYRPKGRKNKGRPLKKLLEV
jgi:hypothetical protein